MNIGIDIDDTIADTYEVMFAYAQKYTVEDLKRSAKIKELDNLTNHFYTRSMHSWTQEEEEKFFEKYYEKIIKEIKPFTCAIETLKKLKEEGNQLIFITARFEPDYFDVRKTTLDWLKRYDVPYDKLIINPTTKKEAAIENDIDVFIDDSYSNCKDVISAGIESWIMNTRCNKGIQDQNLTRVYSWPHIKQIIEERIN